MSDKPLVIVTRPEPGATETAERLRLQGFKPVLCPMSEIVAVPPTVSLDAIKACSAVAVTSANALRHCPDDLLAALHGKPVHAVGEATAAEARARGLAPVITADGDADRLGRQIAEHADGNMRVVYLAGRERTGTLERSLSQGGIEHVLLETYETKKVSYMTYKGQLLSLDPGPVAVLFHSGLALDAFKPLLVDEDFAHVFEKTVIILISDRLKGQLPTAFAGSVLVAPAATDAAMLHCLGEIGAN